MPCPAALQLAELIHKIKSDPHDRRLVLSAWNPAALKDMALPPCHMFCQVGGVGGAGWWVQWWACLLVALGMLELRWLLLMTARP